MSIEVYNKAINNGTRFKVFPQSLPSFSVPELIYVNVPPDSIREGPSDDKIFIVDAINKMRYSGNSKPPYMNNKNAPVKAGPDGHFDHLNTSSREFKCAATYASIRRVYDIWQDYFKQPITWYFQTDFERLEIIPFVNGAGAWTGYGFIEFGFEESNGGLPDLNKPHCQNFDVIAHEFGHALISSVVGTPSTADGPGAIDYRALHESSGDVVAIVAALHFETVVSHLLANTKGDLFGKNELSRIGELKDSREFRLAFNNSKMSDAGTEAHARSLPLTGGIFDILVEVFQKILVQENLISQALADASTQGNGANPTGLDIPKEFEKAYLGNEAEFEKALLEARDYLGTLLAETWSTLDPDYLNFQAVLKALLRSDKRMGAKHQKTIRECFEWREITISEQTGTNYQWGIDACGFVHS